MLSALLALLVMGVVGIIAIALVFAVISMVFGLVGFLLFKVAPLLLLGWVVVKLVDRARAPRRRISAADQRWLDGE